MSKLYRMTKAEARKYIIDHCNPNYPDGDT